MFSQRAHMELIPQSYHVYISRIFVTFRKAHGAQCIRMLNAYPKAFLSTPLIHLLTSNVCRRDRSKWRVAEHEALTIFSIHSEYRLLSALCAVTSRRPFRSFVHSWLYILHAQRISCLIKAKRQLRSPRVNDTACITKAQCLYLLFQSPIHTRPNEPVLTAIVTKTPQDVHGNLYYVNDDVSEIELPDLKTRHALRNRQKYCPLGQNVHGENFMAIFTTLSVVIWLSTGTLGIFATLVYVFTVVIYDILGMAIISTLSTSILFCNLYYILL